MTTHSVDVEIGVKERTFDARRRFDARGRVDLGGKVGEGGKLTAPASRTQRSGSYGGDSSFRESPRDSTRTARRIDGSGNYGNPRRTHVDVKATEVPGSQRQTLGNRARVAASNAKGALGKTAGMAGRLGGRVSPGVGINAKGDIDFGLRAGGAGVSLSVKGDISLGVPGLSATVSPRNGDTTVDIGFGGLTIESTRVGCTITVTVRLAGKIINQDTRNDCAEPEPTPEPTPTPTPSPTPSPSPNPDPNAGNTTNNDDLSVPEPGTFDPPLGSTGWFCPMYVVKTKSKCKWVYSHSVKKGEKIGNYIGNYYDTDYDIYYMDYGSSEPEVSGAGMAEAGKFYDLSREEKGKEKESGYLHYYAIGDPWSMYYPVGNGRTLPKPYAYNGWKYSQGVPELTFGYTRYYDRVASTNANEPRYTFGYLGTDPACVLITNPYYPNAANPYETKPRAIPPMNDEKCCELNKRIYEMLGGDEFYKNGLIIPNKLYVPQGVGSTQATNYNGLFNLLFRILDHRTLGDVKVVIPDNNKMMKGDQKLEFVAVNATGAFNKLLELAFDSQSDNGAQLNLNMRMSYMLAQILRMTVIISEATKSLLGFFNVPTSKKVEEVDLPIDISLGSDIGKEPQKPSKETITKILDLDNPEKTEAILDKFMNLSKMPVTVLKFIKSSKGGDYWWFLNKNRGR